MNRTKNISGKVTEDFSNFQKRELVPICERISLCEFSTIPIVQKNFCYQGGGCPEEFYPIIKGIIKRSLEYNLSK